MHISTMLVFWSLFSLIRNSVVLAVYLLFSVACFFTVHEHSLCVYHPDTFSYMPRNCKPHIRSYADQNPLPAHRNPLICLFLYNSKGVPLYLSVEFRLKQHFSVNFCHRKNSSYCWFHLFTLFHNTFLKSMNIVYVGNRKIFILMQAKYNHAAVILV